MNDRDELAVLKQEQARLEKELGFVSLRLTRLERRLNASEQVEQQSPEQLHETAANVAATQPPPLVSTPAPPLVAPELPAFPSPIAPVALPPLIPHSAQSGQGIPPLLGRNEPPPRISESLAAHSQPGAVPERSLELRLGTYWAPRIGIVVLLTGLVFIGNLAYQTLGALGKVLLLYGASAILLGAGSWWQRNGKDTLKNYAQVLFAGGLATLYFTTYAAHHLESLRVIESTLLDGVLLLGCAGFMVWTADRWRSEILAMFGIGLAYYTCVMTRVGSFTLYSNLVLTIAAVFFLVRNRWLALSFGSLLATYAAYGFWRFFSDSHWHWASPSEGLWSGTYFLASYWVVFTTGVFLSRDEKFAGQNRATFLTLNNGAFFTMFLLTMLQVNTGGFWRFCLVYGSVLLALAEAANRVLPQEQPAKNFYLTQGLLLITIGLISKFAGLQLALILAAESFVLLMLAYQRRNIILLAGAYIVAGLAIGWGMDGMKQDDPAGVYLAIGLGALMLADTLFVQYSITLRTNGQEANGTGTPAPPPASVWSSLSGVGNSGSATPVTIPASVRPQVAYFAVLALVIWLVATWNNVSHEHLPLFLAAEGLALTISIYFLRVREITLFSQGYLVLAMFAWFVRWADAPAPPWWNPLLLILIVLALSHWWQKQRVLAAPSELTRASQLLYALGIVGLLFFWLHKLVDPPTWIALTSLLAVGLTVYGVLTRAWMLAACGQVFVLVSSIQFGAQLLSGHPSWLITLTPIAAVGLLSWATIEWFKAKPESDQRIREPLLQIALLYRWLALPMCIAWVFQYVPERGRIIVLALLGLTVFLFAGWMRSREALAFGAVLTATSVVYFWLTASDLDTIYWANLIAILLVLTQQQIAKKLPAHYLMDSRAHGAVIVIGGLTLWWFCTRWVLEQSSGFFLTASWSLLALVFFTCGIVVRERVYRWLGLSLLALALGRIVIVDIWRLETLYRILSFMALGIVLLVLGFVYSKYQEKIRQWL